MLTVDARTGARGMAGQAGPRELSTAGHCEHRVDQLLIDTVAAVAAAAGTLRTDDARRRAIVVRDRLDLPLLLLMLLVMELMVAVLLLMELLHLSVVAAAIRRDQLLGLDEHVMHSLRTQCTRCNLWNFADCGVVWV